MQRQALSHGDKILLGSTTILKFSYHDKLDEMFQRQMSESALRDGLTKTFNKRYLSERLESEFTYAARHATPLALLFLDIDHFKKINDAYGHPGGDFVLTELSKLITDTLAPGGHPRALRRRGVRDHLARDRGRGRRGDGRGGCARWSRGTPSCTRGSRSA